MSAMSAMSDLSAIEYFKNLKDDLSSDQFDENEVKLKMQTVSSLSLFSDDMDAMERTLKISKLKDNLNENIFDKIQDQKDKWLVMLLFKVCNDIDPTRMQFIRLSILLHQNKILNSLDFLRSDNNENHKIHNINDDEFDAIWNDTDDEHFNDENDKVNDDVNDENTETNNLQLIPLPKPLNYDDHINNEISARSVSMNQITTRYFRDFVEIEQIGFGAFGTVHLSEHRLDKKLYAIKKIIYKHSAINHDKVQKEIVREVVNISKLNHQNVVRYFGSWIEPFSHNQQYVDNIDAEDINNDIGNDIDGDNNNNHIDDEFDHQSENKLQLILASDATKTTELTTHHDIMSYWRQKTDYYSVLFLQTEYCGKYNLKQFIQDKDRIPEIDQIMDIFGQIVLGLSHIHSHKILHRDLKPENIFLIESFGNKLIVKIGDFGLSKSIQDCVVILNENDNETEKKDEFPHLNGSNLTQNIGTLSYAAPEITDNHRYGTSADIYSLGIILWELIQTPLFGQERFFAIKNLKQKQEIDKEKIDTNKFEKLIKFILKMTSKDPSLRPTSYSLLENDDIKSYWTKSLIENAIPKHSIKINDSLL